MARLLDRDKIERVLIGLLIGFVAGCGIDYLGLVVFNWLCQWIDKEPVKVTFWSILPLGVLLGLSMAVNMINPPLGD